MLVWGTDEGCGAVLLRKVHRDSVGHLGDEVGGAGARAGVGRVGGWDGEGGIANVFLVLGGVDEIEVGP